MANSLVSSYRRSMALFAHAFREATWTVRPLEAIVEAVKRRDAKQAARRTEAYFLENERRLLGIETDGN